MPKARLTLPMATPSLNQRDKTHWSKRKGTRDDLAILFRVACKSTRETLPQVGDYSGPLQVTVTRYGARELDYDNLVGGAKPLVDCLKVAKMIEDDDPKHVAITYLQHAGVPKKKRRTEIELRWRPMMIALKAPEKGRQMGGIFDLAGDEATLESVVKFKASATGSIKVRLGFVFDLQDTSIVTELEGLVVAARETCKAPWKEIELKLKRRTWESARYALEWDSTVVWFDGVVYGNPAVVVSPEAAVLKLRIEGCVAVKEYNAIKELERVFVSADLMQKSMEITGVNTRR